MKKDARGEGPESLARPCTEDTRRWCEGNRVLIVGGSDNAADIAGNVCRTAARTFVSIRHADRLQGVGGG